MKKIEAFVSPVNLDDLREKLGSEGVHGLVIYQAGSDTPSRQKRRRAYRGSAYAIDMVPLLKLEVMVADERVDAVVEALKEVVALDTAIVVMSVDRAIVCVSPATETTSVGARQAATQAQSSAAHVSSMRAALGSSAVMHVWRNATC